jgi:predicted  nucleic acid-binding Zn-ribbon protein
MTDDSTKSLKELQEVDLEMERLRRKVSEFEPMLSVVEEPADVLAGEVETLKGRLKEMKVEERKLEHSADDRRSRLKLLQERLKSVRNLREEAAVRAELDLLEAALEGDEQEALTLLDQIRRLEERLEEKESSLEEAKAEIEPRRQELLKQKAEAEAAFAQLEGHRTDLASSVPTKDLRSYERIRGGGRSVVVATLTPDGACGHCFGMVPLQLQNEIRRGAVSITCEACGVLLSAGEDES